MRQKASNLIPSGELSNSPLIGLPSRTESEEPGSGDGSKSKDDLYLFTRGQVFKKSSRRSPPPHRSSFPLPSPGILKLSQPTSFVTYPDSGFDTPSLSLSFSGHPDVFSYSGHGGSHGYHSSSSTPGMPPSLVPPLDLFPLDGADHLPMFGSDAAGGADHASSASWLQSFGIPDAPTIGFGR